MSSSFWKTKAAVTRSTPVTRPSAGQVFRQVGIIVAVLVVWAALFAGYMGVMGTQTPAPVAARPKAPAGAKVAAMSTLQPTRAPATAVPTVAPSATPVVAVSETRPAPTPTTVLATNTPIPATPTTAPTAAQPGAVSYAKDVQPLLDRLCVKCHGGEQTEAFLSLASYADLMKGSENGPVVTPGKSADSLLIDLINQGKMPKRGPKLLPGEIRVLTQWVDAGAPNN